ncbi:MAG: hypothetical protein A2289_08970 [Deltaproteobacteria bacterium RIFOXYA12_FULL_58_15]|nr:MAG: hypothetical protein A2289_08970 [Deltaproteobacteria bacterium RIFOXYA12_FULL_58_15]
MEKGDSVTLDGTASSDSDGDALSFDWIQVYGEPVSVSDAAAAQPTFVAPGVAGDLVFSLLVGDGTDTALDSIVVTVVNRAPVSTTGDDQLTKVDFVVTLSGSGSDDDPDDILTYDWTQTHGPPAALDDPSSVSPSFLVRAAGTYEFSLVVSDEVDTSAPATVAVFAHDIDGGEDHTLALKPDGTLWAWGLNVDGQLGDGTSDSRDVPARVCDKGRTHCAVDPLTDVTAVAAGRNHSLALKSDGTVWSWGDNNTGQLGDGTQNPRSTPGPVCDIGETDCAVHPLRDVIAISAGYLFSVALKSDGTVWAWGVNYDGELGNGIPGGWITTPTQVCAGGATPPCSTANGNGLADVLLVAGGGGGHTLALKTDGTLWGWGYNKSGQVGRGAWGADVAIPEQVCDTGQTAPCSTFISDVSAIDAWSGHTLALKSDGSLWAWGGNQQGELGAVTADTCQNGTCSVAPIPVCLSGDSPCTTPFGGVASFNSGRRFSTARRSDGTVWTWGDNAESQLGTGNTDPHPFPVQVCAAEESYPCSTFLSDAVAVATGSYHALVLLGDGSLWAWGDNDNGQLGSGNLGIDSPIPLQVIGY